MSNRDVLRDELKREEKRLVNLDAKREQVVQRIAELKRAMSLSPAQPPAEDVAPPRALTSAKKIALFRSLFRGRTDVFPTRWVNAKKGTAGYSPACSNEWVRGVCEKPRVRCGECPHQSFVPVSDQVVLAHLHGDHVAGVYPLLSDDTCWFVAADFDKGSWMDDVSAFMETCQHRHVPVAVERSRSGNGAHVWFFFDAPVAARSARTMACYLLTKTMERRHELPMDSYDRLFPNQDTMPRGGFGNLIALPFQNEARERGNSLFVDEAWVPYTDQWAFLASLRRMSPLEVEGLAREAIQSDQVIGAPMGVSSNDEGSPTPWLRTPSRRRRTPAVTEPLPAQVRVVAAQLLFVDKQGLPSPVVNEIKRLAAFQNPEFYKKQAMRLSTAQTPRVIDCAEASGNFVGLPRGCLDELEALLAGYGIASAIEDERIEGEPLDVEFHGNLATLQQEAADALLAHDIGVFVAPPGTGKTVIGTHLVARRARSTLVLVHRTQLLEQWVAQLALFLKLKPKQIGQIGGGKRKPNGCIDVAMIQSLVRRDNIDDAIAGYGHVIVDECHHVPAVSFERVMREVKARYVTGLTATPRRRDGHHPIIELQLGPIRYTIDAKSQAAKRSFEHRVIVRDTAFRLPMARVNAGIQEIYGLMAADEQRNTLILNDVVQALEEGRSPILLTERREHLDYFAEQLGAMTRNLIVLRGGMRRTERRATIEQLATIPDTEERLILATGRFAGEGFDDARLDTLFLAMPVSWRGTLIQYAGRLHRRHQAKTEVRVFDYVDAGVPMLARMFEKRRRGYRAMGYTPGRFTPSVTDAQSECTIEYDQAALKMLEDVDE